jgi:hypothetical protein
VETLKEIQVMIIDRIFLVPKKTPTHKGIPKGIPKGTPTQTITEPIQSNIQTLSVFVKLTNPQGHWASGHLLDSTQFPRESSELISK